MSKSEITIIDYGLGNLLSVARGLEHVGAKVRFTSDPRIISQASKLVLPGVGAFPKAMQALSKLDLIKVLQDLKSSTKPVLAICLGMQLLLDESHEFEITSGLGLIPGKVIPVPRKSILGSPQKIPHIGWSTLNSSNNNTWRGTVLEKNKVGDAVYFVHSFMAQPSNTNDLLATVSYGGKEVPAVIYKNNIYGCQFHPEKSGKVGLQRLDKFKNL